MDGFLFGVSGKTGTGVPLVKISKPPLPAQWAKCGPQPGRLPDPPTDGGGGFGGGNDPAIGRARARDLRRERGAEGRCRHGAKRLLADAAVDAEDLALGFEPDGNVAISGSAVALPQRIGMLRDALLERDCAGIGGPA